MRNFFAAETAVLPTRFSCVSNKCQGTYPKINLLQIQFFFRHKFSKNPKFNHIQFHIVSSLYTKFTTTLTNSECFCFVLFSNVTVSDNEVNLKWLISMSTDILCVIECLSKLLKHIDTIFCKNVYHDAAPPLAYSLSEISISL